MVECIEREIRHKLAIERSELMPMFLRVEIADNCYTINELVMTSECGCVIGIEINAGNRDRIKN